MFNLFNFTVKHKIRLRVSLKLCSFAKAVINMSGRLYHMSNHTLPQLTVDVLETGNLDT